MAQDASSLTSLPGNNSSIDELVSKLPEIYQPIFGHDELSQEVSRRCDDRKLMIEKIYLMLSSRLKRPLRVLDLGCAQGFFSLSLAALGASVVGVDYLPQNISVCSALASEHPTLNARFELASIDVFLKSVDQGQYDIVLGLSVFHHLVHRGGAPRVIDMLSSLASHVEIAIFELALATEPIDWARSQPSNPRELLAGYAFVHEITKVPTHLSTVDRPLYFASNSYWHFDDHIGEFTSWTKEPHALSNKANQGSRRYYFAQDLLIKQFLLDQPLRREPNIREHTNEVAFLLDPPTTVRAARLRAYGNNESENWVVRERLPGSLLCDVMRARKPYNAWLLIEEVLHTLTFLEKEGLYHSDLRTWNVLIDETGRSTLIDYGAIDRKPVDCEWPHNLFLSFMIFAREVVMGTTFFPNPIRSPSFNPDGFPEPLQSIFKTMYNTPTEAWSFSFLSAQFSRFKDSHEKSPAAISAGYGLVIKAMEEACEIYSQNSAS